MECCACKQYGIRALFAGTCAEDEGGERDFDFVGDNASIAFHGVVLSTTIHPQSNCWPLPLSISGL